MNENLFGAVKRFLLTAVTVIIIMYIVRHVPFLYKLILE